MSGAEMTSAGVEAAKRAAAERYPYGLDDPNIKNVDDIHVSRRAFVEGARWQAGQRQ